MHESPNAALCPAPLQASLVEYARDGKPLGGFLQAVIENDLLQATTRADAMNLLLLHHIVAFVNIYVPAYAWGSKAAYQRHIEKKERERQRAKTREGQ